MLPMTRDDYDNGKTYKLKRTFIKKLYKKCIPFSRARWLLIIIIFAVLYFVFVSKYIFIEQSDSQLPIKEVNNEDTELTLPDLDIDPILDFPKPVHNDQIWSERQMKVKKAFKHAWDGYVRDAWGNDEYHPISHRGSNLSRTGIGFTIVDSLDTLLIMDLKDEYNHARDWVANSLDFNIDGEVNVFETTIRVLGGLLSAYHLSGNDGLFLAKAIDLGDRLLGAFSSPSGIPYASVNLARREGIGAHFNGGASSTSEATTLQLEFKYLSYISDNYEYWDKSQNIMFAIDELKKYDGLVPIFLSPNDGQFWGGKITLGARGDSYYEYLLKQFIQTSNTEHFYRRMYDEAIKGVKTHLIDHSYPSGLLYIGELSGYGDDTISPKMDHLVCFMGGNLALGATQGRKVNDIQKHMSDNDLEDLDIGKELTKTCVEIYFSTSTGLAPEIAYFSTSEDATNDIIIKPLDSHNLLRPETVESLFILWRLTGDVQYREWGWKIFQAFEKYSKVDEGGYTSLDDVTVVPPKRRDKMETFWLAETLKYFYLLFGPDDLIPLDKYVFNTEAHPLPIISPTSKDAQARIKKY
ncbi:mannosyl-oligosaccharide alpha-1,2-mannosidase [Gigaspora margarita]|uniref:alpha-1,2-Mannosidase n=1 Tax=Gigaspora margarita TaxID=4874 RepID=A0A8H4A8A1_GIGMA|nr:mannosyl-oligosaccharide alpha-1,2-mannosidase [Gigaspora margarita]